MRWLFLISSLLSALSIPLHPQSLITLRTTQSQPSAGGNRVLYKQLVLEEWSSSNLLQNWSVPCTLPDLASETLVEGLLRSSYPFGDGVWFLCRNVPVGSNTSYTPAPVLIMNLQENGELQQWASDTSYPPGTSANLVYTWYDSVLQNQVFYTLGGFSPPSSTGQIRPAQPRIRMDTGPGTAPDLQGALANIATNVFPTGLSIMTDSLYIPALLPNGTSPAFFSIYETVPENTLPTTVRTVVRYALYNEPLMLSVWTFPFIDIIWYTGFNRVPYLARTNFSVSDPTQMTMVFPLPPSSSSGTLGGPAWRVNTARFEGDFISTGETVYLNNGTTILKNTVLGLAQGQAYQAVLEAPPGWKYFDIHSRSVFLPTPSATPTATASATASSTGSSSSTPSASATATSKPTVTPSPSSSSTSSTSTTPSPSSSASATPYPNQSAQPTVSNTPSTTPSNGSIPLPPNNAPTDQTNLTIAEQTGIGLGTLGVVCVAALILIQYTPSLRNLWTQRFGSSFKPQKKPTTFRKPVSADVPITISHNPHVLLQHRLEQLKDLQKQVSTRDVQSNPEQANHERKKKEFGPVITATSV